MLTLNWRRSGEGWSVSCDDKYMEEALSVLMSLYCHIYFWGYDPVNRQGNIYYVEGKK